MFRSGKNSGGPSSLSFWIAALVAILLFVLVIIPAFAAAPIRLCGLCSGFTISKKGDDVLIRCPGQPLSTPWLTIKGCRDPVARRVGNDVTITCQWV